MPLRRHFLGCHFEFLPSHAAFCRSGSDEVVTIFPAPIRNAYPSNPSLCFDSRSVDNPVDNPVDNLWIRVWIRVWITRLEKSLWLSGRLIHRLSTGKCQLSTILSAGNVCAQRPFRPLIHSFHRTRYLNHCPSAIFSDNVQQHTGASKGR